LEEKVLAALVLLEVLEPVKVLVPLPVALE
jgi:hypothetical protein